MILDFIIHTARAAETISETAPSGPVQLLGLDWKLFLAQLINFAIVLLVLWKWVFGPLGKKLEERAERIEESERNVADIAKKHSEAEEFRLKEIEKARDQASEIIHEAQKNAELAKQQIMTEARSASEKLIEQTKIQLASEKDKLLQEVRSEAATMVALATEKIINIKLNSETDKELIRKSLERVR